MFIYFETVPPPFFFSAEDQTQDLAHWSSISPLNYISAFPFNFKDVNCLLEVLSVNYIFYRKRKL